MHNFSEFLHKFYNFFRKFQIFFYFDFFVCFSVAVSSTDMLRHRNTGMSTHRNSDEKIIFPDGRISSPSTISPRTMIPVSGCRKGTFCENVADYPTQLVNAAIARNTSLKFLEIIDPVREFTVCHTQERVSDYSHITALKSRFLYIRL